MDDRRFDDIIKKKIKEYEADAFAPESLAAFHAKLNSSYSEPFYTKYRTELIALSAVTLLSLIIMLSQWYWKDFYRNQTQKEISILKEQQHKISSLESDIAELKQLKGIPDTVYTIEYKYLPINNTFLQARIEYLEKQLQSSYEITESTERSDLHEAPIVTHNHLTNFNRIFPHQKEIKSERALPNNEPAKTILDKKLSTQTIRDIEKHYQKGIGVRIGPSVELSHGFYNNAKGATNFGAGIYGDFILSPFISIESGVKYIKHFYAITNTEDLNNTYLPGVNKNEGELTRAEVDYWMLEIPFNLKYRLPITLKKHFITSAGYSPTIYTQQIFEYNYNLNNGSNLNFTSSSRNTTLKLYSGTLNFSLGYNNELPSKKIIEASLFYQKSLGGLGLEKATPQFIGIKSTYWFTLK